MVQISTSSVVREGHDARRDHALIELTTDGIILTANETFLEATGYALEEIVGKHHSLFEDPHPRTARDHRKFWAALARGETRIGAFKLIGKDGRAVWLRANFIPVHDAVGRSHKVVKYLTQLTRDPRKPWQSAITTPRDLAAHAANDRFIRAMRAGLQGS